jgi:hypothetical protein
MQSFYEVFFKAVAGCPLDQSAFISTPSHRQIRMSGEPLAGAVVFRRPELLMPGGRAGSIIRTLTRVGSSSGHAGGVVDLGVDYAEVVGPGLAR